MSKKLITKQNLSIFNNLKIRRTFDEKQYLTDVAQQVQTEYGE